MSEIEYLPSGSEIRKPKFHYAVFLCHSMDDVPLRLFDDRDAAFDFAKTAGWDPPETMMKVMQLPKISTPTCITIVTFRDGEPISRVVVRAFEDEAWEGSGNAST